MRTFVNIKTDAHLCYRLLLQRNDIFICFQAATNTLPSKSTASSPVSGSSGASRSVSHRPSPTKHSQRPSGATPHLAEPEVFDNSLTNSISLTSSQTTGPELSTWVFHFISYLFILFSFLITFFISFLFILYLILFSIIIHLFKTLLYGFLFYCFI